jgi:hypothetical protein
MTVEEFLTHCKKNGWHFTFHWVSKKLAHLKEKP